MTCAVVLWVLLGTPAGYVSARLYKSKNGVEATVIGVQSHVWCFLSNRVILSAAFGGEKWKTNVLLTALLCPGYSIVELC